MMVVSFAAAPARSSGKRQQRDEEPGTAPFGRNEAASASALIAEQFTTATGASARGIGAGASALPRTAGHVRRSAANQIHGSDAATPAFARVGIVDAIALITELSLRTDSAVTVVDAVSGAVTVKARRTIHVDTRIRNAQAVHIARFVVGAPGALASLDACTEVTHLVRIAGELGAWVDATAKANEAHLRVRTHDVVARADAGAPNTLGVLGAGDPLATRIDAKTIAVAYLVGRAWELAAVTLRHTGPLVANIFVGAEIAFVDFAAAIVVDTVTDFG